MPTFYNFTENGLVYSFDDIFVPADLFREGNLWTWGSGSNGRLGNASTVDVSTPVTTFSGGANWKQIDCSNGYTSAIKTDGTLWLWGSNSSGALGNASTVDTSTPVTTFLGGTDWKQVSESAAIKTDGTLWVWGSSSSGRLGNGATSGNISTPVTTFLGGTNWKQVSGTSAIKTDGTLWTWGANSNGALGNASTVDTSTPVTTFLGGNNWKEVNNNNSSTLQAIKTDGTLWVWGLGSSGQLGNASTVNTSTPVTTFLGGTDWNKVNVGTNISAIKTDGTLWMWGSNVFGGLGNAKLSSTSTPVTTFLGGNNWKQVSSNGTSTAAIKTDGTLWVWGYNLVGRLGNASTVNTSTPVTTFLGGTNWKQSSFGSNHSAVLTYIDPTI